MYIHRMTQSEKLMVGCKPLCMRQYLQDMDIHYDYVHWINTYMGLCITRNKMIGMLLTVQCFTCENQYSDKWFGLVSLRQATIKIVRVRNDFMYHFQILLSLNTNKKQSQLLPNSFNCFIWFHDCLKFGDSPQLFNSKLISYSSFQLSDLLCFNTDLQFCDQNSLVQNGITLCTYHYISSLVQCM